MRVYWHERSGDRSRNTKEPSTTQYRVSVFQSLVAVTITWLLSEVSAQVNSEIDQFEDLLAVDSFANEVIVDRPRPRFNKNEVRGTDHYHHPDLCDSFRCLVP